MVKRIFIIITIVMLTLAVGCSSQNKVDNKIVRSYADPIAEKILKSGNEVNYSMFSEDFNEQMKKAIPQDVFTAQCKFLKDRIGIYTSKEYASIRKNGKYISVIYKAKFTNEPKDVMVNVTFEQKNGKNFVAGLFYNSPNLNKK